MDDLLNTAPCGFLSFADDGTITTVNATLLEMLGYQRDELVGRSVETILTIGSRIFYQTHFFPLVRLHGSAEEIFLMLRGKTGQGIGVLSNVVRRERDGSFANDCVFIRVRERQKYEDELLRAKRAAEDARSELETASEELQTTNDELLERTEELDRLRRVAEEANRAKSTFLAVMSHELRTPLNAIAGYTQLLEMGIHGPVTDAQREALGRIERSERHLLRLINDVLNLSRIEAGRVDYLMEDVPLATVLAGVMPMVEPQLGKKALTLETAVAPDLAVRADPEKVQQILLNLLGNAIKFTPSGGRITVDALRPAGAPEWVLLRVTDTGIGIPSEKVASIFEPFVQVDVSPTGRSEGTGLGLAISRDLARGMGGELRVESIEGEGSTFTLALQRTEGQR